MMWMILASGRWPIFPCRGSTKRVAWVTTSAWRTSQEPVHRLDNQTPVPFWQTFDSSIIMKIPLSSCLCLLCVCQWVVGPSYFLEFTIVETVCSKNTQPDAVKDCPPMDCQFAVSSTHTFPELQQFGRWFTSKGCRRGVAAQSCKPWLISPQHRGFCVGSHMAHHDLSEIIFPDGQKGGSFHNHNSVDVKCEIYEPQVSASTTVMCPAPSCAV